MTPIKRPLAAAGAAVLLALSLTACGGAPADASVEDFCKVTQDEASQEEFVKAVQDEDWDKIEELIKDQADEVEGGGTLSDAMAKYPKAFDKLYVNMINAGEAGGEFGVKELVRPHAEFGQAGQILARRVKNPLHTTQGVVDDERKPPVDHPLAVMADDA